MKFNNVLMNAMNLPEDIFNIVIEYDAHSCLMKEIRDFDRTDFNSVEKNDEMENFTVWGLTRCYETLDILLSIPYNRLTELSIARTRDRINSMRGFY
jgi:hypothetical protein